MFLGSILHTLSVFRKYHISVSLRKKRERWMRLQTRRAGI